MDASVIITILIGVLGIYLNQKKAKQEKALRNTIPEDPFDYEETEKQEVITEEVTEEAPLPEYQMVEEKIVSPSTKKEEESENIILKDFDIKNAIIYSEILNPKFKEY